MSVTKRMIPNRRLLLPYFLPYIAYVFIASVFGSYISIEANYILRIIVVTILIVWGWQWYIPIKGPKNPFVSVVIGITAGFIGVFIWILLLNPFVHLEDNQPWSKMAFILRLFSAGLIVPVFEELLMRGYILRFALQWDNTREKNKKEAFSIVMDEKSINNVQPGAWSWLAIIISTVAFTLGHNLQAWPASVVFGLLMAWLWVLRKDLIVCIMAHSVTNIALAFYIFKTGNWNFW
jgi:CAAX prenyl protease-like protein